jgi:hypothetical protein
VASLWPCPFLQLSSRKRTSRNLKSKKQFLARPETRALPCLRQDLPVAQLVATFLGVSQADFPAGFLPTLALNQKLPPSPRMKISGLPKILRFLLMARIRRGMKVLRSRCPRRLLQNPSPRATTSN